MPMLLLAAVLFFPLNSLAATTPYSSQLNSLNQQVQKNQQQAAAKAQQAADFQSQISSISDSLYTINQSINKTDGQIGDTEATISDLSAKIKLAQDNITAEKTKLGQILSAWYMQGDSGLLESVLGSNNISDVVDAQEQFDAVKQQINANIDKIAADEAALSKQKDDQEAKKQQLASLQDQQKSQKTAAETEKNRKNNLLSMTLTQQQQYLDAAKKAQQEISRVSADEAAWRAAQDSKGNVHISTGGTGGYPYGDSDALDPWLFYQEQCTSYAAWYWNNVLGKRWYNTQPGRGDARYWNEIANTLGYTISGTPRVGAIISWQNIGSHGHVAIVQAIHGDGTIDVSEYNWIAYSYSYRSNLSPGIYGNYVYIY